MDLIRIARGVAAAALLAGWATTAAGQTFPAGPGPYRPGIPTVAEIRGGPTGATFTVASEAVKFLERLASTSPRVVLDRYGTTPEGRPLVLVWISAPGNLAGLDELRAANAAHASGGSAPSLSAAAPLFVWFAFGVHGDEPAGPEAALELAYHLAASLDPVTTAWLEHVVVVIDPLQNPDGHARYVNAFRARSGPMPDPDPGAAEHQPSWPTGRTNALLFDLNRDWAWGIMPETRARWEVYLETLPQVVVDFHEMDAGSTYFFFPPAEPIHRHLPASTLAWAERFGRANAAAFRSRGWAYYTRRDFDLLYPGYADAWSSFHGATGMTYEQAGGGRAGLALEVRGGVLTLAERIEHHLQAALATLAEAAERREERLTDFARFWGPARRVPAGAHSFYLIAPGPGADGVAALLEAQGVRVEATTGPVESEDVVPLPGSVRPAAGLPAGTLVVPSNQSLGRFAAAMLDPDTLTGSTTSDVSAWALPLLFDVPAYAAGPGLTVKRGPWRARKAVAPAIPADVTALAWPFGSLTDAMAALRLAGRGEIVWVAQSPIAAGDDLLPRGSFVFSVSSGRAAGALRILARLGVEPRIVTAPIVEEARLRALRPPQVAVVGGEPVLETSLGAVRHLLSRAGVHAHTIEAGDLTWADLAAWDVIVLPDGVDVDRYSQRLEPAGPRLEQWVEAGGTLVGVRAGAAALAVGRGGEGLDLGAAVGPSRDGRPVGRGRAADPMQGGVPGVLMTVRADPADPLGQGFPDGEATVMAWDPMLLERSGGDPVWSFTGAPPRAGLLPAHAGRLLAGRPYVLVRERGRGRVVLFADDPGFRGMLPGLEKLYLNATALQPALRPGADLAR